MALLSTFVAALALAATGLLAAAQGTEEYRRHTNNWAVIVRLIYGVFVLMEPAS